MVVIKGAAMTAGSMPTFSAAIGRVQPVSYTHLAGKDRLIFAPGCGFPQNVELIFRYPLIKEALEEVMEEMQ